MKQEDFFNQITTITPTNSKEIQIYSELIFNRFLNTLKNSLPRLYGFVGKERFSDAVHKFIASGEAKSEFLWKIGWEFGKFIKTKKIFNNIKFANELLWLEFTQISILMNENLENKIYKINWQKQYKLSKTTRIKKLKFTVFNETISQKNCFLLCYIFQGQVFFREISELVFCFLKLLKHNCIKQALKVLKSEFDFDENELKTAINQLVKFGIFTKY